jgi:type VI secretion system secreted protein Hcp
MTARLSRVRLSRTVVMIVTALVTALVALNMPALSPAARPTGASALTPAALNGYMSLKGQKQGDIKGSVTQRGREGKIQVIAFDWGIQSPRDAASGLPVGKRLHKPFTFTAEIDQSHPKILQALANNENITTMEFQFWTPQLKAATGVGSEVQYLTYRFTNATISAVSDSMDNNKHPDLAKYAIYTRISITYQKVEVTWTEGGITFADDWATS